MQGIVLTVALDWDGTFSRLFFSLFFFYFSFLFLITKKKKKNQSHCRGFGGRKFWNGKPSGGLASVTGLPAEQHYLGVLGLSAQTSGIGDEILSLLVPALQAKVLRRVSGGGFLPVGSTNRPIRVLRGAEQAPSVLCCT